MTQLLGKYATQSRDISAHCCLAIFCLSYASSELKDFLGMLDACEFVVHAASMHIGDSDVSEYSSLAILILACNNNSNRYKLSQAGACDIIAQIGNFGFNIRNHRSSLIARNVCYAIAQLTEAMNATRLIEAGVCELVCELFKVHKDKITVVSAAIKAICGLASLSFPFREALSRSSACSLIIENIPKYDDKIDMIQEACEAMMHLSLNPSNSVILGSVGGCEVIVKYLDKKLMEHPMGVDVCCGALLNLVTYGETAKKNRLKILNAGAVDHIRRALASTKASYRARESALQLLEILGADRISGSSSSKNNSNSDLVGVVNMNVSKGGASSTIPLAIEKRETYTSFDNLMNSSSVFSATGASRSRSSSGNAHGNGHAHAHANGHATGIVEL